MDLSSAFQLAVSDTATIIVAIITGIVGGAITGLLTSRATIQASKTQAGAAIQTAREARFASWQNQKRETYAAFLTEARKIRNSRGRVPAAGALQAQADAVVLVAYDQVRNLVREVAEDPKRLRHEHDWKRLVDALNEDVSTEPHKVGT